MKLFEVTSNIIKQNPKSKSLRTTIPSEIAGIMELSDKDKLVWIVGVENNEPTIKLKKEQIFLIFFTKTSLTPFKAIANVLEPRILSATIL